MGHCPVVPSERGWPQRPHITNSQAATREGAQGPMRNRRIVRTLVLAGTAAMLSALSLITTVMAATGGGDFPLRR